MDNIKIAKAVAELVVGTSVSNTVVKTLKHVVPVATRFERIQLAIGAYSIGAMAAAHAVSWADEKVDETHEAVLAFKSAFEKTETAE